MTEISEREGFLHDTQFGFRKRRATEEAILIFNTVLTEAKLRKIDLYLSFVDLKKAYDRVSRPALFKKLLDLGFGGRVFDVICDMYTGDSLYIQVNGELCRAMYLAQGLKQGSNLSPLFFSPGHSRFRLMQHFNYGIGRLCHQFCTECRLWMSV